MSKLIGKSSVIVFLAFLSGCASQEDTLVKEQISLLEKTAEKYETVTDKASMENIQPSIKDLNEKLQKSAEKLQSLPGKDAAMAANQEKFNAVMERLGTAKRNASKAAGAK
jgi:ABC-type enterochelin transport system substrate-binding protein